MLTADAVVKRYPPSATALAGVSLTVASGSCVALVGESGSGKTTLLRCFNRLVVPDEGVVRVDGADVAALDPIVLRRAVGYVQQESGLLPHWTARRNVALVPWLRGMSDAAERAERALTRVGLDPAVYAERRPAELSGGQRQRVAMARAIAAEPAILLLDEPFGALDAITRADAQALLLTLRRDLAVTVLLVTHDLREAFRLADRVAVMRAGRIEQVATPDELARAPGTAYVAELLEKAQLAIAGVEGDS